MRIPIILFSSFILSASVGLTAPGEEDALQPSMHTVTKEQAAELEVHRQEFERHWGVELHIAVEDLEPIQAMVTSANLQADNPAHKAFVAAYAGKINAHGTSPSFVDARTATLKRMAPFFVIDSQDYTLGCFDALVDMYSNLRLTPATCTERADRARVAAIREGATLHQIQQILNPQPIQPGPGSCMW